MAEITASLVRDLREKTGAGMMDCKKALTETGGELEAAVDWLRKKGLAAAAKKAGRVAAEGLVGVAVAGRAGAVVEVNSETDFVARNETFQDFVRKVSELAIPAGGDMDKLRTSTFPGSGHDVAEQLTQMIATIGENMTLRRSQTIAVDQGLVASYVHNAAAPGLGKIGVLVALESEAGEDALAGLGKQLAMHVAAANPQWLDVASVDAAALDREREVLAEQARASGKPDAIIAKMVEGRLRKYYEEVVLPEQAWIYESDKTVKQVLAEASKAAGKPIACKGFIRYALGEGIEKQQTDFASEVAATLKQD